MFQNQGSFSTPFISETKSVTPNVFALLMQLIIWLKQKFKKKIYRLNDFPVWLF